MISICIPNYNYEKYLSSTLASVLKSSYQDFEIVIADNASTDSSIDIIKKVQADAGEDKVRYKINNRNLGFAGNLDAVGNMAKGQYMIMLSSDDVVLPDALETYAKVLEGIDEKAVLNATWDLIDSEGKKTGIGGPDPSIWKKEDIDPYWTEELGCDVYKVESGKLLSRCFKEQTNPFNFASTLYTKESYQNVSGYGTNRLINPDKWFHWKLLMEVDYAYHIDIPLFQYRWHHTNQNSQQAKSGHLKYVLDEYRGVVDVSNEMLEKAGITREEYHRAFIYNDIIRHGLGELSKGRRIKARRIYHFGRATFPDIMSGYKLSYVFYFSLLLGHLGTIIWKLIRIKGEKSKHF